MNVLIACETSGNTRRAFRARGHNAWSCDLLPADDGDPHHMQCDVLTVLYFPWDLVIAHPTCTYLTSSGLHWNKRRPERAALTEDAIAFARIFIDGPQTAHIQKRVVENPIGCLSTRVRKPDQIIQPHQFGHDASKATCLWLHGVELLQPTKHIAPRMVNGRPRWANQSDSGQNLVPGGPAQWKIRSETYPGISEAMATQWS